MKTRSQGFTLIELIIVIVILGILAVTASPRFLDLTGDARVSTLQGVEGSIEGAVSIVNGRALIHSLTGGTGYFDDDNDNTQDANEIGLVNGYPDAESLVLALELDDSFTVVTGDTIVRIYPDDINAHSVTGDTFSGTNAQNCYIQYTESTGANTRPAIADLDSTTTEC